MDETSIETYRALRENAENRIAGAIVAFARLAEESGHPERHRDAVTLLARATSPDTLLASELEFASRTPEEE